MTPPTTDGRLDRPSVVDRLFPEDVMIFRLIDLVGMIRPEGRLRVKQINNDFELTVHLGELGKKVEPSVTIMPRVVVMYGDVTQLLMLLAEHSGELTARPESLTTRTATRYDVLLKPGPLRFSCSVIMEDEAYIAEVGELKLSSWVSRLIDDFRRLHLADIASN